MTIEEKELKEKRITEGLKLILELANLNSDQRETIQDAIELIEEGE